MKLAYEFAYLNSLSSRFNSDKKLADKDGVLGFCKWQNLSQ
jgi:hypothetical protein